jgi:hypothetical protein
MKRVWIRLAVVLALVGAIPVLPACRWSEPEPCGPDWVPVDYPDRNDARVTIEQGIWGDVWFWEGDFMPMCPSGTATAAAREMRVHELTSEDDVEHAPGTWWPFYSEVRTPLVASVWSDADGFFEVALPPGMYSLFAVEDTLFYANGFDGYGNIYPVTVRAGQVTEILFNIDYLSTW